ncbi:EH signature domain-containing protein [Mesorhizobium sp. M0142]|uniref:EH signature domain-containing protein n=1 Tax=Mesorhizobium sp. M0142 TaxID=2956894 RepID=UPI00333B2540
MASNLRDTCVHIANGLATFKHPPPSITPLSRLAGQLQQSGGALERRAAKDYDAIAGSLIQAVIAGAGLSNRQLRDAAWCLWSTTPALAQNQATSDALLRSFLLADSPRPFLTLASSFMASFSDQMPAQKPTSDTLAALAVRWGGPWGSLQQKFKFFDLTQGPRLLARDVINQDKPATDILKEAGLSAINAKSGYAKAVTVSLLDQLALGGEKDHIARLGRIRRYALTEGGKPLYEDLRPNLIEALLRPFENVTAEKPVRDAFLEVVLYLFGDPRLKPGNWSFVPAVLREIVQRWLTEQSLRQFLDIVDRVADDSMWRYRRAFWEGVFNKGLIDDAWVAFGPDGKRFAKELFGKEAKFASLETEGRQIESGHAVLLLHIGDGVVADWSHNGKCNIWSDATDRSAPRLFKLSYGSDEIRIRKGSGNYETDSLLSLMHLHSPTYHWQGKVAERLRRMTGIQIKQPDYRLRK